MPHGMEIINDDYTLQLSNRSPVLVYVKKGTHLTTTNPISSPVGTRSRLIISNVSASAVVAIRPNLSAPFCIFNYAYVSGNLEVYFMCSVSGAQSVDWYVFDTPNPSGMNYGLEVYDESGNLTYQSFANPIRATSVLVANTTAATNEVIVPNGGRTIAAIQGNLAGFMRWDPGANGDINLYWKQMRWSSIATVSTGLSIRNELMDRDTANIQSSPGPTEIHNPRNYMIVDVTGL